MFSALFINLFGMCVIAVLLIGVYLPKTKRDLSSKRFSVLLWISGVFLVLNGVTELLEGQVSLSILTYIVNLLAFYNIDLIFLAFARYLSSLIDTSEGLAKKSIHVVYISCVVRMLAVSVLAITDNLFVIDNGCYSERPLCAVCYVMSCILLAELFTVILLNRKRFTKKQFVIMLLYVILPIAPLAVETVYNFYSLTIITLTVSLLFIYVVIQATTLEKNGVKEAILTEMSYKDLLTGLKNRRAYYERLKDLKPEEPVGIMFCDINHLKVTNDTQGHLAGDQFILDFSALLCDTLGKNDVFRMSGDEFLILISSVPEDSFEKTVRYFRSVLQSHQNVAAMGSSFGVGADIEHLVSLAEEKMYEDKRAKR